MDRAAPRTRRLHSAATFFPLNGQVSSVLGWPDIVLRLKDSLKKIGKPRWRRFVVGKRNGPWHAALASASDTCNTGWRARADQSWTGWTGRINRTLRVSKADKSTSAGNAVCWLGGGSCGRASWASSAHRLSARHCSPKGPKANGPAGAPSGACLKRMGPWMPCAACAARPRPRVGICRTWPPGTRSWRPLLSSKTSRWKRGPGGTCLPRAHFGVGVRGPGQCRPTRPLALRTPGNPLAAARLSDGCPVRQ